MIQPEALKYWRADEVAECLISDDNKGLYCKLWDLTEVPVHQEVPMSKIQSWWPMLTDSEQRQVLVAFKEYEA